MIINSIKENKEFEKDTKKKINEITEKELIKNKFLSDVQETET